MDGGSDTTGTAPSTGLDGVVSRLQSRLDKLTETLAASQSTAKKATFESGVVKTELDAARKAADVYSGAKNEADSAVVQAGKALDAVQVLITTLSRDDVDRLSAKIAELDAGRDEKRRALNEAQRALAATEEAARSSQTEVERVEDAAETAQSRLSELPVTVKQLAATVKAHTLALAADTEGGQALKAFLDKTELVAATKSLSELISDAHVDGLAAEYESALIDLSTARAELEKQTDEVAHKKADVAAARSAADAAVLTRQQELDKLRVPPKTATVPS